MKRLPNCKHFCRSAIFSAFKNMEDGLERWLSGYESWLFFQSTWVLFPAPTWRLITICNSNSRGPDALLYPFRNQVCTWCANIHSEKKNTYAYKTIE